MAFNIDEVLDGWQNYLAKSEIIEEVARKRAAICAGCPHIRHSKALQVFVKETGKLKEVEGCYCGVCTCPTSALIRSPNKTCSDDPKRW